MADRQRQRRTDW